MIKPLSQTQRLLIALQDGARHTVPYLIRKVYNINHASSARLASRIYDLKQQGHYIETYHVKGTLYSYQLIIKTKFKKV